MEINDIGAFITQLREAVKDTLETEIQDAVKKKIVENVEEYVYGNYEPTQYERRRNTLGGLQDPSIMKGHVEVFYNDFTLEVGNYSYDNETKRYVQPIVEKGRGYTWKNSEMYRTQPRPRPFMELTQKDMGENVVSGLLKIGLKKRGIDAV